LANACEAITDLHEHFGGQKGADVRQNAQLMDHLKGTGIDLEEFAKAYVRVHKDSLLATKQASEKSGTHGDAGRLVRQFQNNYKKFETLYQKLLDARNALMPDKTPLQQISPLSTIETKQQNEDDGTADAQTQIVDLLQNKGEDLSGTGLEENKQKK